MNRTDANDPPLTWAIVTQARDEVLKLVDKLLRDATQAELVADLDRAALAGRIAQAIERGVPDVTCFGGSREQSLRDADEKWERAHAALVVARAAAALTRGGLATTMSAIFPKETRAAENEDEPAEPAAAARPARPHNFDDL